MNNRIKRITYVAIFAAIISVISPWSIKIGAVPITLATFTIYLTGSVTKKFDGLMATLIYIVIGLIGLPVFSSFNSGIGVVVGPTGGYLVGYLPGVLVITLITSINKKKFFLYPIAMILGTFIWYTLGTIWYMILTNNSLIHALTVCVIPFLIFDLIKIIIASIVSFFIGTKTNVFSDIYPNK